MPRPTCGSRPRARSPSRAWARLSLVDGRGDLLAQRLSEYCALYYPTASAATFNGQATVSWDEGTVSFSLALDTRTRPDIPVTYDKSTLDFMVGKGAHR